MLRFALFIIASAFALFFGTTFIVSAQEGDITWEYTDCPEEVEEFAAHIEANSDQSWVVTPGDPNHLRARPQEWDASNTVIRLANPTNPESDRYHRGTFTIESYDPAFFCVEGSHFGWVLISFEGQVYFNPAIDLDYPDTPWIALASESEATPEATVEATLEVTQTVTCPRILFTGRATLYNVTSLNLQSEPNIGSRVTATLVTPSDVIVASDVPTCFDGLIYYYVIAEVQEGVFTYGYLAAGSADGSEVFLVNVITN